MRRTYILKADEIKKEKREFVIKSLSRKIMEQKVHTIGVMTSGKYAQGMMQIVEVLQQRIEGITFVNLKPINTYAEVIDEVKKYDAVLLIEKYVTTTYSEFERTLKLLHENNVEILGLITYK